MAKKVEEPLRFSMAFIGKVAPAGRKVQGSNRPELTATSTKDKFTFNEKACRLMGIEEGTEVLMIDQNLYIDKAEDKLPQEKRFYVAVAPANYPGTTATVGGQKSYSYSGIWAAILMQDPSITEATVADLVRANMGITRGEGGKSYVGTKKVAMELVQYIELDEENNVVEYFPLTAAMQEANEGVKLYSLVNHEVRDHEPKSVGKKKEGEVAEPETEEEA